MNLTSKINLLQGTSSDREFSRGNTFPLVARPWGLHHWSLQTAEGPWMFHPEHRKLQGVRLTHQPSPWMNDYGNMLIAPFTGPLCEEITHQASAYRINSLGPSYLKAELLRYGIALEMTPTERGALFVFTRLGAQALRVRFFFEGPHEVGGTPDETCYVGVSRNHTGGVAGDFGLHFAAAFSVAPQACEPAAKGCIFVFPQNVDRLELRLAGSFISQDQARTTLKMELRQKDLPTIAGEGEAIWNALLGRIAFEARDKDQERTFYSCLYRCLLFPRFLDEKTEDGRSIHYSPYDGRIHDGPLCADSGFWDTYRTLYPLLALAYPDKLRLMLEGWLNACRESGWSPKWPSPGARDCMIGTHYNVIVADAVARGITDWNVEEAFSYLWKDATEPAENGFFGRVGLKEYVDLGYVPADKFPYAASATLDYAYDDFCIGRVARFLGKTKEAQEMERRALNYRNVFDPAVGFMRGRLSDGNWLAPFCEFKWGNAYIEGGAWQHTFNVPHDPAGLATLFGGKKGLCDKLDAMLATPPHFSIGNYPSEIHEMTEMAMANFGQYAHSNQPVHHFLFLYDWAGQPEKTTHWVHRVANELYSPKHFPGDEDNGEMAAWYVFACLGLFPRCPGTADWVRFTPLARSASVPASIHGTPRAERFGKDDFQHPIAQKIPSLS